VAVFAFAELAATLFLTAMNISLSRILKFLKNTRKDIFSMRLLDSWVVAMQRIYAPVDDPTLDQIDQDVKEKDISRAQWVSTAIDTYLKLAGENGGTDPSKLQQEMAQLRTDNERLWKELQDLKKAERDARIDAEQLRSEISAISEQMQKVQLEFESARSNVTILQHELEHYRDTINQKYQQITFLQGHVSQLTQSISQLALPQMTEEEREERKKRWWQFWKGFIN